jgi:hypothetical protein
MKLYTCMNFSWNCVLKNKINIHHNTTCTYIPPSLSGDDIPETSNVKCTGRFEGTGVDVVDVVETVSFWDSSFFVVAGSLFFSFFLGTGYEYDECVFVTWVLQVRRAEVVTNDQPVSRHGHLFYGN